MAAIGATGCEQTVSIGADVLDGCPVLGLGWDPGDHSMRHHGERAHGQVYPATLEALAGEAVLRWIIPPYDAPCEPRPGWTGAGRTRLSWTVQPGTLAR